MKIKKNKFAYCLPFILITTGCDPFGTLSNVNIKESSSNLLPVCTNDTLGVCQIVQVDKNTLEPNLIAANIKNGITIFGVLGTYIGGSSSGEFMSMQHRDKTEIQVAQLTESVTNSGLPYVNNPTGYRAVPRISKDHEGRTAINVDYVNRTGWVANTCGTSQSTVDARIADCAANSILGDQATWNGGTKGNAGQGIWKLVTRTADINSALGREVWRDERTKMLWSSALSINLNWCKASGSNDIAGNPSAEEDTSFYCNNATYQNTSGLAISACFEDGNVNFTTTDVNIDNAGKAGLNRASTPSVSWRLPSRYDYYQAENNGIRFVMPDMGDTLFKNEWTTTTLSSNTSAAWFYFSGNGSADRTGRNNNFGVRCIGR